MKNASIVIRVQVLAEDQLEGTAEDTFFEVPLEELDRDELLDYLLEDTTEDFINELVLNALDQFNYRNGVSNA